METTISTNASRGFRGNFKLPKIDQIKPMKVEPRNAPFKVINEWPHEFNMDTDSERKVCGLSFMSRGALHEAAAYPSDCSSAIIEGSELFAYDDNDSVYDSSYQTISTKEHPKLRANRLKKLIRKDCHLQKSERTRYKQRRNIIKLRCRQAKKQNQNRLQLELPEV